MRITEKNEIKNGYLVIELDEPDLVDTFAEGMLKNSQLKGFIVPTFQQINLERAFFYDISLYYSLRDYLANGVSKVGFLSVFIDLVNALQACEEYMLDKDNILISLDYLFVDKSNSELKVLYLPLENFSVSDSMTTLIKESIMVAKYKEEQNDYISKVINYANSNSNINLADFKRFLMTLKKEKQNTISVSKENHANTAFYPKQNGAVTQHSSIENQRIVNPTSSPSSQTIYKQSPIVQPKELKQVQPNNEEQNEVNKQRTNTFNNSKIPSVSNMNKQQVIENPVPDKEIEKKEKKGLFSKKDKEEKKVDTKPSKLSKIKKDVPSNTKIPTAKKRIKASEAQESINVRLEREVMPNVQAGITQISGVGDTMDLSTFNKIQGTTILGNGETTYLGDETTVLQQVVNYNAKIVRLRTGETRVFSINEIKIGRELDNDFSVSDNSAVSAHHLKIIKENDLFYLIDQFSTNFTYYNSQKCMPHNMVLLESGTTFKIANEDFAFEVVLG